MGISNLVAYSPGTGFPVFAEIFPDFEKMGNSPYIPLFHSPIWGTLVPLFVQNIPLFRAFPGNSPGIRIKSVRHPV